MRNRLRDTIAQIFDKENIRHEFDVSNGKIYIYVEDGDWKHDHGRLKIIMEKYGFIFVDRKITNESDGDWFSAEYTYIEK